MTATNQEDNIVKYRKRKPINIGLVIFGIIFVYLIATIIMYLTAPRITVYEVRQGSILKDNAYTGLAIREERVVLTDASGYVNYFAEDASKVRVGTKVYTLSNEKLVLEDESSDMEVRLTDEERASLLRRIQEYNNQFQENDFASTYQLKNELQGSLNKITSNSKSDQLESLLSSENDMGIAVKTSAKDGVLVYSMDELEGLTLDTVTLEHLRKSNYKKTEFINNTHVDTGEPVYKLVTNDKWQLLVEINAETKAALSEKKSVKVNFKKDNQETRADISFLEGMETPVLCLSFDNSMIRYVSDRYLDIELILEDETGLKIPKSAETSKEFYVVPNTFLTLGGDSSNDGVMRQRSDSKGNKITEFLQVTVYYEENEMIYLDPNEFNEDDVLLKPDSSEIYPLQEKRSLKGVYSINKGYAVFKQIKILCESDDYYIIEEGNSFGLSNYDHIALDSQNIKENDVVF
ncbi:MAG: hypothetical protein IJA54_07610 [Tyzzerella sp.]|nr:hypothetical protein [Tyzzerella sp.]